VRPIPTIKGGSTVLRRLTPYGLLAGLALFFFAPLLLQPDWVLYSDHSDFLVQHLPARHFLVRSWRADGEMPLWCPYYFAGAPFLHDIQVAAFYPPQAVLYFLPDELLGPAMSWLVVAHVIVAGWGAYAYGRSQGLGVAGGLVTGLGYMFAGKWMLHLLGAGHHNFAPLAWLPLIVLLLEQAIRRAARSEVVAALLRAAWAGGLFGILCLGGQPQLSFYAGLFLALWTLGPALETSAGGRRSAALARWAGLGVWAALWAVGLFAVQLLPTAEATQWTTRAVSGAVPDPPATVVRALVSVIGPSLAGEGWDYQGGFGLLWVVAAVLAPVLVPGRVRFQAAATLVLVLFAIGGPFLEGLPLFKLFRIPPRMFLIAALPISLLAGTTTQALFHTPISTRGRRVVLGVVGALLLAVGLQALLLVAVGQELHFHPYWAALAILIPAALWLPGKLAVPTTTVWRLAWGGLLLLDLWALALPLVDVLPEDEVYKPSTSVRYLAENADRERVLDRDAPEHPDNPSLEQAIKGNTPLGYAQPLLRKIETVRGLNPIDVHRYMKYLQFIADRDEPIVASGGVVNFEIKNRALLDLLGTRYLLQPMELPPEDAGWNAVAHDELPFAFVNVAGGIRDLPSYTIYENSYPFPRAFVVPEAAAFPTDRSALATLKDTDFHKKVLLEPAPSGPAPRGGKYRAVAIREYRPNRVVLDLGGEPGGYLVLTDVWFPGWTCTVDGQPAEVARADYIFRGVRIPDGTREVVFRFAPESYRLGRWVTGLTLALLAALSLAAGRWLWLRRSRRAKVPGACG
jgi:type IV secretory pathway VirB2 component (pilin)